MTSINSFRGKYSFLSNFYPCTVELDGMLYPSVEHAFQAAKTFDIEKRKGFQVCPTPADAKSFGRQVDLRSDWESVKIDIMLQLVRSKFIRNRSDVDLSQLLVDTGDAYIEEDNNHKDQFWGTVNGVGRNELGKILMQVRSEIIGGC